MRTLLAFVCVALAGCAPEVGAAPMAIHDPLALIDDVQGPLRLYVLPAASHTCDATTGMVSPEVPDLAEGMFTDAVADVSVPVMGSGATSELTVLEGEYTVLVRGKGTDPVSGRTDVFIATACANATIEVAETRAVRLTLLPIVGSGECGDGVLSPDEQCEDGGMVDGDGCSATCRTETVAINTTTAGLQNRPRSVGRAGQRWLFGWDSDGSDVYLRVLESDLSAVTQPSVRGMDAELDTVLPAALGGAEFSGDVAMHSDGRQAIAFVDVFNGNSDIKVAFANRDIAVEGQAVSAGPATGLANPAISFAGNGAALVVFEDGASATGLSGRIFAAGSSSAEGASAFEVGSGATNGAAPDVIGAADHFIVVFSSPGGVFAQRFGTDGSAQDAAAVMVAGATASAPTVAAQPDGRALFVWQQSGDISARTMAADGTLAEPFVVNSTTAGDQSAPSAVAGGGVFAVAFASGAGVRARVISAEGAPLPNRDAPPTTADFEVAPAGSQVSAAYGGVAATPMWLATYTLGDDIQARPFPLP